MKRDKMVKVIASSRAECVGLVGKVTAVMHTLGCDLIRIEVATRFGYRVMSEPKVNLVLVRA